MLVIEISKQKLEFENMLLKYIYEGPLQELLNQYWACLCFFNWIEFKCISMLKPSMTIKILNFDTLEKLEHF